jgi:hypothetical protein
MAKKQEIQDKRFELYERAHTHEYYAVAKWLSEVSFAPAVLGVDQVDVWRKIEKLCELYEAAIYAERARNAKLERKLRSMTVAKNNGIQGIPEQPKAVQVTRVPEVKSVEPEIVTTSAEDATQSVQKEITQTVSQVMKENALNVPNPEVAKVTAPKSAKNASHDEDILLDLIREFGPEKGGKNNG